MPGRGSSDGGAGKKPTSRKTTKKPVTKNPVGSRGSKYGPVLWAKIKHDYVSGMAPRNISEKYGISTKTIASAALRHKWKNERYAVPKAEAKMFAKQVYDRKKSYIEWVGKVCNDLQDAAAVVFNRYFERDKRTGRIVALRPIMRVAFSQKTGEFAEYPELPNAIEISHAMRSINDMADRVDKYNGFESVSAYSWLEERDRIRGAIDSAGTFEAAREHIVKMFGYMKTPEEAAKFLVTTYTRYEIVQHTKRAALSGQQFDVLVSRLSEFMPQFLGGDADKLEEFTDFWGRTMKQLFTELQ